MSSLMACRLRAARLDSAGYIIAGADNMVVSDALIQVNWEVEVAEGAELEQRNGCDEVCVTSKNPDTVKRVNLNMTLCHLDIELIEILAGGDIYLDGADPIGYQVPGVDESPDGASLEVWTKRWNNSQQASGRPYWRWGFPLTKWRWGNVTLENGILAVPLSGVGEANTLFANGPLNDWPGDLTNPFGFFADTAMPAATCGAQATPAQTGS
jgi:hypothetical protein